MKRFVSGIALAALVSAAAAAEPQFEFGRSGVTVRGLKPGSKVAWMALVRENHDYHKETVILRGYEPVTPAGALQLDGGPKVWHEQKDAIWTLVDVDELVSVRASSPEFTHSDRPLVIRAVAGETTFAVQSIAVEVMYVRRRGGVWSFGAGDGATLDGDRKQNGTIVIALETLQPYKGNPHPPERIEEGDLILVIDSYEVRAGQIEVTQ